MIDRDLRTATIEVAIRSDNPAIVAAFEQLLVLVQLVEPVEMTWRLTNIRAVNLYAEVCLRQLKRDVAHEVVDEVFETGDESMVYALDNLIDVARKRSRNTG